MRTLIVGGGLSGLALADALDAKGRDYLLLEARSRFGGRILTEKLDTEKFGTGYFDMGPAWFWPGQPRIAGLIDRLGLTKFEQFCDGNLTYEDEQGDVRHGKGFAAMQGSWRLKGGLGALIDALVDRLPDRRRMLHSEVVALTKTDGGIAATLRNGDTVHADQVVMSLPPRIAAKIVYTPALPQNVVASMQGVATWMAGQAKAIAVYDTAFWRDAGLSGDAQSRHGPMVEVHDASPVEGGPYALFGFIGVAPHNRVDEPLLRQQVQAQFIRLFGSKAAEPCQLYLQDWAYEAHTSTEADKAPLYAHPTYGMSHAFSNLWGGALLMSGTEVAPEFGGFVEGALEAAENTLIELELKR